MSPSDTLHKRFHASPATLAGLALAPFFLIPFLIFAGAIPRSTLLLVGVFGLAACVAGVALGQRVHNRLDCKTCGPTTMGIIDD